MKLFERKIIEKWEEYEIRIFHQIDYDYRPWGMISLRVEDYVQDNLINAIAFVDAEARNQIRELKDREK